MSTYTGEPLRNNLTRCCGGGGWGRVPAVDLHPIQGEGVIMFLVQKIITTQDSFRHGHLTSECMKFVGAIPIGDQG